MAFNVTALAAYTKANETQLLTKALFGAKSISLFTPQIGVKSTQQVNTMDTDAVFQADSCGWSASGTTTFSGRTLTVAAIKVQEALCPKDLNTKYLQLTLPRGSKDDSIPFEQKYAEYKTGLIAEQLETGVWQGNTASGNQALARFDGLIKIIDAASGVIEANVSGFMTGAPYSVSGGITVNNVINIMQGVYRALPIELLGKSDVKIFIGMNNFRTYQMALTNANLFHYNADSSVSNFEIVIPGTNLTVIGVNGLNSTNRIYAMQLSNVFFGTDLLGEEDSYEIFYAKEAMEVRYNVAFKAGVQIAFPEEIVKFTLA
jgi:hypothetical protein